MADQVVVMDGGLVRQVGTPEEIYRTPSTAFVAEFLGVTNVLAGCVAAGDGAVEVAGAVVPGAVEGARPGDIVTVVFKADAAVLFDGDQPGADAAVFEGDLVEVLFVGSAYRHCVAVGGDMLLVDAPAPVAERRVRVAVPRQEVKVFPGAPVGHEVRRSAV